MNVFIWIVQSVLAVHIGISGFLKLTQPKEKLAAKFPWMHDTSQTTVRLIGVVEVLGAIGLIAPKATGIAPVLTPVAAAGLSVFMILATALHLRRKEYSVAAFTTALAVIYALTAWATLP